MELTQLVWLKQLRNSDFLEMPIAAIDVFAASNILELTNFCEDLLLKSQPQLSSNTSYVPEAEIDSNELVGVIPKSHQLGIRLLHLLALVYSLSCRPLPLIYPSLLF